MLSGEELERKRIKQCLEHRKQAVVHHLAKRFYERLYAGRETEPSATEWVEIESLSQLRSHVGGRFQNLKQRWVAAGFPLREHRGDRSETGAVNESAWVELATWIAKQGFEARLVFDEDSASLIELRKT